VVTQIKHKLQRTKKRCASRTWKACMTNKTVIVSGYATVDYPVRLPLALMGPQTSTVEALVGSDWPRAGGAALYASRRIAAAGHHAKALVALGDDSNAALYLNACHAANVEVEVVACDPQPRTPWCMLLYHDNGSYTCLIERGDVDRCVLIDSRIKMLAHADLVCIAAGTAGVSAALLDGLADDVPLAWIAKRDPVSFPIWLIERLARRADFIFCNASERRMVDAGRTTNAKKDQCIIETRGADGVLLERSDGKIEIAVEPVQVQDATGAGDTLAGEVLATLLSGHTDMEFAMRRGIDAAQALLLERGG
jgi:ribokinase